MIRIVQILVAVVLTAWCTASAFAFEPLGYPWSTWGEIAATPHANYDGIRADGYIEQGVDWTAFDVASTRWVFNSFLGLRFATNSYNDYWGNKVGPWFGLKLKHDFQPFGTGWGQIAIGVRGEVNNRLNYLGTETVGLGFVQWSLGGDWKRRK